MEKIWKESYKITSYHVDFQEKLKPTNLMQFFQEAAGNHAIHLGAGYQSLREKELFWALSRLEVEIRQMPRWGDEIHVETWPCSIVGPFFRRDFIFYNSRKEELCKGVSGWLLLSPENMRPQRIEKLGIELPDNEGKRSLDHFPDRLNGLAERPVFSKKILYNEIDSNCHVNNTRYLDWVMDCFDKEFIESHLLKSFQLEFLSEMLWGDDVELLSGSDHLNFHIQALNSKTGKIAFKADIGWTELL
jgi:acyl-ACP thioesterase